jgi:excisionase family DNA binding protein
MTEISLTIPAAVTATGLSRTKIYEALKSGDLTAFKSGRRTLIRRAELEAYVARLPAYRPGS